MRSDVQASIPSPSSGVLHLGPFPLRAYAVCIILGVIAAVIIGDRRWVARGGRQGTVAEVATYAVPAGIVGARLYHVITSFDLYDGRLVDTLKIWQGGLGIWGGVAGGALGAWLYTRRHGIALAPFADAVAPGIAVAQAIGRFGNYFNQELFGKPTDVAWALRIDLENRPDGYLDSTTFHPTFAYEVLWNLGVAGLVLWADHRFRLGRGRAFALYVTAYCAGRFWIESLRIDEANKVLGLRLNIFTSLILFVLALAYLVLRRGTREDGRVVQVDDEWPPALDEQEPDGSAHEGLTGQGPRDG
jgi:prolipoprotein diacylglyceryl transferase